MSNTPRVVVGPGVVVAGVVLRVLGGSAGEAGRAAAGDKGTTAAGAGASDAKRRANANGNNARTGTLRAPINAGIVVPL